MTPQAEPRRHHYVPQCWLAGFAEDREHNSRLWVTDFSLKKQWPSSPINAGHIRDFYRLPDPSPDPIAVEKFFSALENDVAPVLKLLDNQRRPANEDELDLILTFMAYQFVRLPSFRPFMLEVAARITREAFAKYLHSKETWKAGLQEAGLDPEVPGASYEAAREFFESGKWNITAETDWHMARAFQAVDRIIARLRERHWHTSITNNGRLIASDNPVILDGERNESIGFRNAGVIVYAISRHIFLTGTLAPLQRPTQNYRYFAHFNTMTLLSATRQVYSHQPDFIWRHKDGTVHSDWTRFTIEAAIGNIKAAETR